MPALPEPATLIRDNQMTRKQKETVQVAMAENLKKLGWAIDRGHYKLTRNALCRNGQEVIITVRVVFNPNRVRVERLVNATKTWALIQSFSYDEYIKCNEMIIRISGV